MVLNLNIKELPLYLRIIIASIPSLLLVILFIFLIYLPKNKEIDTLNETLAKLSSEIANSEVKARRLDALKAENAMLKAKLLKLQEQLPEEKEVSVLLKQISDLGLKSGLEILLWKPEARRMHPGGLYVEIPVRVEVLTGYHNLGVFFSHISRLSRIVNIADISLSARKPDKNSKGRIIMARFTALTFAALTPEERQELEKKKRRKRG